MLTQTKAFILHRDKTRILQENLGWQYNGVLTAVTFRVTADGWLAVIKANLPAGPMVAFLNVNNLEDATRVAAEYAGKKQLYWKRDKYPVKVHNYRKRPASSSYSSKGGAELDGK